jgi:hypothetical protein
MSQFHTTVSLRGYRFEDFTLTVALNSAITAADVGKALTWDSAAANRMKLAGDGDLVIARLDTFEDRKVEGIKVGTAEFKFAGLLPIKSGETVNVGDTVVGAGNGEVKTRKVSNVATPDYTQNYVAAIEGSKAVVVRL